MCGLSIIMIGYGRIVGYYGGDVDHCFPQHNYMKSKAKVTTLLYEQFFQQFV